MLGLVTSVLGELTAILIAAIGLGDSLSSILTGQAVLNFAGSWLPLLSGIVLVLLALRIREEWQNPSKVLALRSTIRTNCSSSPGMTIVLKLLRYANTCLKDNLRQSVHDCSCLYPLTMSAPPMWCHCK
jgi:hypothetical protein